MDIECAMFVLHASNVSVACMALAWLGTLAWVRFLR